MRDADAFFDTSVVLYLLCADADKADRLEELLERKGVISVQVLNEFATVAKRKLALSLAEIRDVLRTVRALCVTHPLTVESHDRGLDSQNATDSHSTTRRSLRLRCSRDARRSTVKISNIGRSSTRP